VVYCGSAKRHIILATEVDHLQALYTVEDICTGSRGCRAKLGSKWHGIDFLVLLPCPGRLRIKSGPTRRDASKPPRSNANYGVCRSNSVDLRLYYRLDRILPQTPNEENFRTHIAFIFINHVSSNNCNDAIPSRWGRQLSKRHFHALFFDSQKFLTSRKTT
jgi:hypothetical protein